MPRTFDPFDELAAMFLSTPAAETAAAMARRAPVPHAARGHVELVIVGHLPVRAGLWLAPFAEAMSREWGSTALVRLDTDEPTVQILRGPPHLADQSPGSDLHSAINGLGGDIDTWIIRAESPTPPADLASCGMDRITILTSADEAAIVAAYQIIKNLSQAAQDSDGGPATLPEIALAVVGVEQRAALAVVDRLNRTTVSFLGVEVKLALHLARIDAGIKPTRHLTFPQQSSPSLRDAAGWIDAARRQPARQSKPRDIAGTLHRDRAEARPSHTNHVLRTEASASPSARSWPTPSPRPDDRPAANTPAPAATPDSLESLIAGTPTPGSTVPAPASRRVKLAPKPAMRIEPKFTLQPTEPDDNGRPVPLASYVSGLTPLPARAPGHERVEFAIDGAGGLHLLGHEASLRELRVVETWAWNHRELLAMACPTMPIDASKRPVCHVFTREPVALSDLHGTDLRLHVLAPVAVNGHTGWFAAPLNAASG